MDNWLTDSAVWLTWPVELITLVKLLINTSPISLIGREIHHIRTNQKAVWSFFKGEESSMEMLNQITREVGL